MNDNLNVKNIQTALGSNLRFPVVLYQQKRQVKDSFLLCKDHSTM